ncbi:unnamed protein product [Schistosoma mattheei]|uniref:Uncharacterized protein n=1 Tax=Schistosoma mattheei TaxID=31246 RepID=A0A183PE13_9TREM|nr:unnamed protein product [Schistosoma mattheei]
MISPYKATWISSNHSKEKQIDHIRISKKLTRSMADARIRRATNIASDYHLPGGCQDETGDKEALDD